MNKLGRCHNLGPEIEKRSFQIKMNKLGRCHNLGPELIP